MKALILKRYGGANHIAFAVIPRPALKPDEMLVQVHAAGLNPIDYMIPKGTFKPMLKFQLPATLGSDLAGVVVEVGSRVTRFKPGDAVGKFGKSAPQCRKNHAHDSEYALGESGLGRTGSQVALRLGSRAIAADRAFTRSGSAALQFLLNNHPGS